MRWQAWQAYGEWFEAMPWDWFCTFTLPLGSSLRYLRGCHRRWTKVIERENGQELRQVFAVEYQKNGTPHGHALVHGISPGNLPNDDCFHAMGVWERVGGGFARIYPYCGTGGAASYCAKYVTKDGEIELIGPWTKNTICMIKQTLYTPGVVWYPKERTGGVEGQHGGHV